MKNNRLVHRKINGDNLVETTIKSARLSMKTKTNSLLGVVLFLLVISATAPMAHAQSNTASWGDNTYGAVSGVPSGTFIAADVGIGRGVAIRTDGTLASWGYDGGSGVVSGTPAGTFVAASAGNDFHNVALRTDGTLVSWGNNGFGQVSNTPAGTFVAVSAGGFHSVAIRADGTLAAWGGDGYGVVSGTPAGTFVAVSASSIHNVAIRTDGTLVAWGRNFYGEVNDTPTGTFVAVSAGSQHSVAIRTDGTLASWGFNSDGQVSDTPAGTFVAASAGFWNSVAVRTDGTLVSWGFDHYGMVSGIPAGTFTGVDLSTDHAIAINAPSNQPPSATDDFYGMNQGSSLAVLSPGVLSNDSDPEDDPLTVELVAGPANGSLQLNPDGSFSYTPLPYFYGVDSFTYRANDGTVSSEIATVEITVSQPGSQGFITGGGRFLQDGRKRTFGFVAKVLDNGVQGNLEFQDHGTSMNVQSQIMQMVYAPNSSDGYFGGTCTVNGVGGYTFFVQLHDRGQPGSNDDFTIWILDSLNNPVYSSGALLSGGNIVIHGY